ncbi:MAG: hypothetical protein AB2L22_13185 [Syntrophales bacterium]
MMLPFQSLEHCPLKMFRFIPLEAQSINIECCPYILMFHLFRLVKKFNRILMIVVFVMILLSGCSSVRMNPDNPDYSSPARNCIDVSGTVLGQLKMNSSIELYRAGGLDYQSILATISEEKPDRRISVSSDQSFTLHCLPEGYYLLNIPAASYDHTVGSPIASESSQNNFRVEAILQGGSSDCYFSAFSISQTSK